MSLWEEAGAADPTLLHYRVRGPWWETLAGAAITLLVTREYEHLVMALSAPGGKPRVSYLRLPHPSGIAVDRNDGTVHIASTRNPNQIFAFRAISHLVPRLDRDVPEPDGNPLLPLRSQFFPGCLYMHDLAMVGAALHANSVGQNAVVRVEPDGYWERVWWPRCVDGPQGPHFEQNYLQLNSIAAGRDLASSYFSASADRISARRPGHRNFPVDGRGVIFSGATREPVVWGLTRPHSARLHGDRVWVDNSGYGEVGLVRGGRFETAARLPGWTRGLCFHGDTAFVGTSRVIPRFRQYAPGLEVNQSTCAVHALDTRSGDVLASLVWPSGNQIFAIDWLPADVTHGFPFLAGQKRRPALEGGLFYAFSHTGGSGA